MRTPGAAADGPAPFLLAAADFYGTLAAVRCLGRAGIPVTVADPGFLAPARWSRFVTRRVSCPSVQDPRFVEWLLAFGEREPGHVLYPTTDDLAFLLAKHRVALSRRFRITSPPLDAVWPLLDKRRLCAAAAEVGFDVPETLFPRDEAELLEGARALAYPLLLKPRTQALLLGRPKGVVVERPGDLPARYRELKSRIALGSELLAHDPGAAEPFVQTYHPEAENGIYSLSGFVAATGAHAIRAAQKVLQRPRRVGIGICFEHRAVDDALADRVLALCRRVGFHGIFEAELIAAGSRRLLIDFNPRCYGQMGFDIARDLPLPVLVHHEACGAEELLQERLAAAARWRPRGTPVYSHRLLLEAMTAAQFLTGRFTREQSSSWLGFCHRAEAVDAVMDPGDWWPVVADVAGHAFELARHPRSFVRALALDA